MSKKKNDNLRVTTEFNKQILFPITQDAEIQDSEKLTKSSWEKLRRNPQYIKLCDGIDFMEKGIVKLSWYQYGHPENKKLCEKEQEARNQFHISQLLDPKKSYDELIPIVHLVDVIPVPIEAIATNDEIKEFHNPRRFIYDGKYLTLKIDVKQKDKLINESFKLYLEFYRQFTGKEEGRDNPDLELKYYEVWDKRLEGTPFSEIALIQGVSKETAKKRFQRAFELILERPYSKNSWIELLKEKFNRDGDFEKLLKLEETNQQHYMSKHDNADIEDFNRGDFPQITERELLQDVDRFCKPCFDNKCYEGFQRATNEGDLEAWNPDCPKLYNFLKSYSHK